ncbi:MAG TPA: hypothetical protein VMI11_11355 [Actinomycetes bacterium]|nr:hypothetical protein [Actinomycetes bacterium]
MTISRPRTLAVLAAASVAVVGAGLAVPAYASSHATHTRVVHGHLVESSDFGWSTGYVSIDRDYTAKKVQFASDITTCRAHSSTATRARCDVALGLRGGLITLTFEAVQGASTEHGTVTGGTGEYRHARGSVTIVEGTNGSGPSTADWTLHVTY